MMRSKALRSTIRSLMTGKALARNGSIQMVSPSRNLRMWSWQVVMPRVLAVGDAVDGQRAGAADALAAVVVEVDRLLALVDEAFVDDVEHFEEGGLLGDVLGIVGFDAALVLGAGLAPDFEGEIELAMVESGVG